MTQRRIIGLTGGIASGKSTVADYLANRYSLPVLDADVYARQAVGPGSGILGAIGDRYGAEMLLPDGNLNRHRLGQIIFHNAAEKAWLEQQIHPFVRAQFQKTAEKLPLTQTLVYAIPLLFEAKLTHLASEIWVVFCNPLQQKERLMKRSQLSAEDAQARINAQIDLAEKCKQANCVLDNSASKEQMFAQIDKLMSPLA